MKKLIIIASLVLLSTPAIAGKSAKWRVQTNKIVQSSSGYNTAWLTVTLVDCHGSSALFSDQRICGKSAAGEVVCAQAPGGRISQGDSVKIRAQLGRTEYPLQKIWVAN